MDTLEISPFFDFFWFFILCDLYSISLTTLKEIKLRLKTILSGPKVARLHYENFSWLKSSATFGPTSNFKYRNLHRNSAVRGALVCIRARLTVRFLPVLTAMSVKPSIPLGWEN